MAPHTPKENGDGSSRNLNTILLWVTLAGLGFIGATSFNNAIALAELKGNNMSRSEVESKLAEVRTSQASLEKELVSIRLDIAKLYKTK